VKKNYFLLTQGLFLTMIAIILLCGCAENQLEQKPLQESLRIPTHAEMISRGKYLVSVIGCTDCHSPKIMTAQGPVPDSLRFLSGHPAGSPLPVMDKNAIKPGYWVLFSADLTAAVGPWGISYTANLTPDSTTGIGAWSEYDFIQTFRTGRHLGQAGGREILPPMPIQDINTASDEDLKAIFAYLKAIPPIINKVPPPASADELAKMK
jgi:hypothetical protein